MADMGVLVAAVQTALVDHAAALGVFGSVNGHEPRNAPSDAPALSLYAVGARPLPRGSGLAVVSVALDWAARVSVPAAVGDLDAVERLVSAAGLAYWAAVVSDLDLALGAAQLPAGMSMWGLDVLGVHGQGTRMELGYLVPDATPLRVATVSLPIIVNDVLTEA